MRTIGLNPTIYAFGMPVPKFLRRLLMFIAILGFIGIGIVIFIPLVTIVPTILIIGFWAILAVMRYMYKWRSSPFQPST